MFKSLLLSAILATTAFPALSGPDVSRDLSILPADVAARVVQLQGHGERFQAAIDAIFAEWARPGHTGAEHELDLTILPPDVAVQVMELLKHGDRFDAAIRAIFIEALNPGWSFETRDSEAGEATAKPPHG